MVVSKYCPEASAGTLTVCGTDGCRLDDGVIRATVAGAAAEP